MDVPRLLGINERKAGMQGKRSNAGRASQNKPDRGAGYYRKGGHPLQWFVL
jgi:hypothetical protein